MPKLPGKSWEIKCSNKWREVRAGAWCEPVSPPPPPGENQTVYPMATPVPAPTPSPQIGALLITYLLPPPGGKGHGLLGRRRVLLRGCPAWEGRLDHWTIPRASHGEDGYPKDLEPQPNLFPPYPCPPWTSLQ